MLQKIGPSICNILSLFWGGKKLHKIIILIKDLIENQQEFSFGKRLATCVNCLKF